MTPVNLDDPSGETLDFSVDLEAQGQALDFDVAPLAKLMVGSQEVAASGWKVNFDHGHHVNGTLSFPLADVAAALTPGAKIMVHISNPMAVAMPCSTGTSTIVPKAKTTAPVDAPAAERESKSPAH